jgi:hypothetical protein
MLSCHVPSPRGARRAGRCATGLVGLVFAGLSLVLALPTPAQAAAAGADDLATPGSRAHATIEFDPFRTFTNCLAEAAHGDSMYPGIDPSEVNACLGL